MAAGNTGQGQGDPVSITSVDRTGTDFGYVAMIVTSTALTAAFLETGSAIRVSRIGRPVPGEGEAAQRGGYQGAGGYQEELGRHGQVGEGTAERCTRRSGCGF